MPSSDDQAISQELADSLSATALFGLQGKSALVTGGGRGIGLMIAAGLCANGATTYICSRSFDACAKVCLCVCTRVHRAKLPRFFHSPTSLPLLLCTAHSRTQPAGRPARRMPRWPGIRAGSGAGTVALRRSFTKLGERSMHPSTHRPSFPPLSHADNTQPPMQPARRT